MKIKKYRFPTPNSKGEYVIGVVAITTKRHRNFQILFDLASELQKDSEMTFGNISIERYDGYYAVETTSRNPPQIYEPRNPFQHLHD
jgi:hypothetical protein